MWWLDTSIQETGHSYYSAAVKNVNIVYLKYIANLMEYTGIYIYIYIYISKPTYFGTKGKMHQQGSKILIKINGILLVLLNWGALASNVTTSQAGRTLVRFDLQLFLPYQPALSTLNSKCSNEFSFLFRFGWDKTLVGFKSIL